MRSVRTSSSALNLQGSMTCRSVLWPQTSKSTCWWTTTTNEYCQSCLLTCSCVFRKVHSVTFASRNPAWGDESVYFSPSFARVSFCKRMLYLLTLHTEICVFLAKNFGTKMEVAAKGQYNVFVLFLLLVCLIWIKAPYIPSVLFRGMLAAKYRMWLVLLNSCDWNTHCCLFCLRPYFALVTNASIGQCLVESTQLHVWVRQGRLKGGTWTRRNVSSWLRVQTARMPSLGPTSSTLSGASVTPTAASTSGHPPSDRGQVRG